MIYFTADGHLDHANIIRYTKRPFSSCGEMSAVLMSNIAETVEKPDTLYVLGDLAFDSRVFDAALASLSALCEVVVLQGNHDPKNRYYDLAKSFKHNKRRYYLCHYPWQQWRPNTVMLHGHCHGNRLVMPKDGRLRMRYDVGVDSEWEGRKYFPVSIEQVERRIAAKQCEDLMDSYRMMRTVGS